MRDIYNLTEGTLKCMSARLKRSMWREMYTAWQKREAEGLTKEIMAERLGVSKGTITRRLNGTCKLNLDTYSDMCRAMHCKPFIKVMTYEEIENEDYQIL